MAPLLWKIVWPFLKELNIQLLYGPGIPLLGAYLRELKTGIQTKLIHMNAHSSSIHNSQKVETSQCPPSDE